MDVSITNRLPGTIVAIEPLALPYVRVTLNLGATQQFLVVTHNHITMAAADALWGVTIDSDGTSSVIGVRFDEAEVTGAPTATLHRVAG